MSSSKLAFLMDGSTEGRKLGKEFAWKEMADGTMEFQNGTHVGRGHFVLAAYAGSAGRFGQINHELRIGYVLGVKGGKCWKVSDGDTDRGFDCFGIAMGWFEDSDGVFVQVTGTIKGIGSKWTPGARIVVPTLAGPPEHPLRSHSYVVPIGIALNETDLLVIPRL
jgi:hypothetical protein